MLKKNELIFALIFSMCLIASPVFANKTSVSIDAPDKAAKGSVIKIKVNITHSANNFIHHTNWVYVKVNGKEIARWEFSSGKLPESENFSRETDYKIESNGPLAVEVEGNCNIHGSTGKAAKTIEVK
ncbi:MAG: desulfoferrodoxin family protein [Spirochaetota bacterium]